MTILQPNSSPEVVFVRIVPFAFLLSSVIGMVMEIALSACENIEIDIFSGRKLFELEYLDIVAPLGEDPKYRFSSIV